MSRRDELIGMVWSLARRSQSVTPGHIRDLIRLARSISNLDTQDCNVGLTEAQEKRRANMVRKVDDIGAEVGAIVYHQSDPRGAPIYLIFAGDIPSAGASTPTTEQIRQSYSNGVAIY